MNYYWITFADGTKGCVGAENEEDARWTCFSLNTSYVESILQIPYPASSILNKDEVSCPPFCYTPEFCSGCSSCPKNPSCSE